MTMTEGHTPNGSVTLDIGPGRGALVIYPDERFRGREIEISRASTPSHRVHTGVHERPLGSTCVLTAIFGSLPADEYLIWVDASGSLERVRVTEAAVTEVTLR
jgi:hypothetical protein